MIMVNQFQSCYQNFKFYMVNFMILEIVDMHVLELMSLDDHRNYL